MENAAETLLDNSCPDCYAMPEEAHTRGCAIASNPDALRLLNDIREWWA
jgi:hypothetical protein